MNTLPAAKTAFLHDERCLWHSTGGLFSLVVPVGGWVQPPAGAGLAESPESKRRFLSLMQVSGLAAQLDLRSAPEAGRDDLERIHTKAYLDKFEAASQAGGGEMGLVAPCGPGSYDIARRSAGLAIAAVDGVVCGRWKNAYALSRPPGHHCLPEQAMGFCFLSNIPIAIEAARARHQLGKVAVIDWDVHHGNGTQAVYEERDDTLTISLHQEHCFPPGYSGADDRGRGRGEGCNINIPLLAGGGHQSYMDAMQRIVVPAVDRFRPELIVVASGFDANGVDPLARMQLHSESFRAMTEQVMALAERHCNGRIAMTHEGGYAESCVPFCGHAVMEAMSGVRTEVVDPYLELFRQQQPGARFAAFQSQLIDEMARACGL